MGSPMGSPMGSSMGSSGIGASLQPSIKYPKWEEYKTAMAVYKSGGGVFSPEPPSRPKKHRGDWPPEGYQEYTK
jgi:hypothetical protein